MIPAVTSIAEPTINRITACPSALRQLWWGRRGMGVDLDALWEMLVGSDEGLLELPTDRCRSTPSEKL
jgi:hypothetical protein